MELTEQERATIIRLVTDYATQYHREHYGDIYQRLKDFLITPQEAEQYADTVDNYLADYRTLINKMKGK